MPPALLRNFTNSGGARFQFGWSCWRSRYLLVRVTELPPESETCEAVTSVDYARVRMGTGDFVLPRQSHLHILMTCAAKAVGGCDSGPVHRWPNNYNRSFLSDFTPFYVYWASIQILQLRVRSSDRTHTPPLWCFVSVVCRVLIGKMRWKS